MTKSESAKVISPFSRSAALADKPLADVVAALRGALKMAERGEIRGLALCYVNGADAVMLDWASGQVSGNLMVSATAQLAYRTMQTHFAHD